MKITLELDIDDALGKEYEGLPPENKQQFKSVVCQMLQKTTANLRSKRLRRLLEEIRNDPGASDLDPEILYAILHRDV